MTVDSTALFVEAQIPALTNKILTEKTAMHITEIGIKVDETTTRIYINTTTQGNWGKFCFSELRNMGIYKTL